MRNLISHPTTRVHHFVVGSDGEGHWIARDEDGSIGGLFSDKTSACRFAVAETEHQEGAVRLLPEGTRLSLFS